MTHCSLPKSIAEQVLKEKRSYLLTLHLYELIWWLMLYCLSNIVWTQHDNSFTSSYIFLSLRMRTYLTTSNVFSKQKNACSIFCGDGEQQNNVLLVRKRLWHFYCILYTHSRLPIIIGYTWIIHAINESHLIEMFIISLLKISCFQTKYVVLLAKLILKWDISLRFKISK